MAKQISFRPFMGSRYVRQHHNASAQTLQAQFRQQIGGLLDALGEYIDDFDDMIPEAIVEVLEPTLGKAIEYCPKLTGDLVDSAYLEVDSVRRKHAVAIGFGKGGQPDYAIYVHEMPYKHEEPTRSKFLQTALDEDYFKILSDMPRVLREVAGT
jgi:hypothetical protein